MKTNQNFCSNEKLAAPITQRLALVLLMLLPNLNFGQIAQTPKDSRPFISATPTIYDIYRDETPNLASRAAICTDPTVIKYVNINMHFIQNDAGGGNFTAESDGQNNYNYTGYNRAEDLVNSMNAHFGSNLQMQLPCSNTTAVLPIRIQYVLKGVYFHRSSDYSNDGILDWTVHEGKVYPGNPQLNKIGFGVNIHTEINIYHINNPSQSADGVARTLGGSTNLAVKIWKDYGAYLSGSPANSWGTAKLLNHEVAHNLSLNHTYNENDGCNDTPLNPNCWNINFPNSVSQCSSWCEVSNNLMDYNFSQSAVTPCQINKMHSRLNTGANPYVHSCDGCMPTNSFFYLPENVCLASNKVKIFLDGRGSWSETSYQIEIYQVNSVGSGIQVGNTYHASSYTGNIGKFDLRTIYNFQLGKVYQVRLITHNSCGGHSSVGWVTIAPTTECMDEEEELPFDPTPNVGGKITHTPSIPEASSALLIRHNTLSNNTSITTSTLFISPNPAQDMVQLDCELPSGKYRISFKSVLGEHLEVVGQGTTIMEEKKTVTFDISRYPSGTYFIELITEVGRQTKQLIIVK